LNTLLLLTTSYILIFLSLIVAISLAIYSFYKADSESSNSSSSSSFNSKSSTSSQSFWRTFVEWSSGIYLYKVFFGKTQQENTNETIEEEGQSSTDISCAAEARKDNTEGEVIGETAAECEPGAEGERAF